MKILIAEDEVAQRERLRAILAAAGHDVIDTSNGTEAYKRYEKQKNIDLVITDLRMPGHIDGLDLVAALRSIDPRSRVWLVSSNLLADTIKHAAALGAEKVILKPNLKKELQTAGIL